jgi:hypothetical protein
MWQALGALRLDRGGSSIQQRLSPSRLARQPDIHTDAVGLEPTAGGVGHRQQGDSRQPLTLK